MSSFPVARGERIHCKTPKVKSISNCIEPRMAMTTSSLSISIDPRAMKYRHVSTSPLWSSVSPGGAWVVLNFKDRSLKHPGDALSNAEHVCRRFRLRCKQMSACKHSGKPFSTEFMSIPFVYVHACWKYSSKRWRSGLGICWKWIVEILSNFSISNSISHLMETNKLSDAQHLRMISSGARIQPLNDRRNITENASVHQSCGEVDEQLISGQWIISLQLLCYLVISQYSHPTNITHIVNIFSASVFGATLPNPTDVNDVNVKYKAVTYLDCKKCDRDDNYQLFFNSVMSKSCLYPYGRSSRIISIVWHMNLISESIEPSINGISILFTTLSIANCIPDEFIWFGKFWFGWVIE